MRALVLSLSAVLTFAGVGVFAAEEEIPRGTVIESVVSKTDPGQSYALYLPSNYTPDKAWPLMVVFDPGARGRNGVDRLQAAAEKYGYVLVGSNNSRNGMVWEFTRAVFYSLVADASSRFRLDSRRVYTAGLSGGARVALYFATIGNIRGVIACSAGLPTGGEFPEKPRFALYATTGRTDLNYSEMRLLDWLAEDRGAVHRLEVFDGGHEWAPAPVLMRAFDWFELQAMRAGLRPRDEALVQTLLAARVAAIPTEPAFATWSAIRDVAGDFKGLAEVSAYDEQARKLGATPLLHDSISADRAAVNRELDYIEDLNGAALDGSASWVKSLAAELRKMAAIPEPSPDRFMAQRILTVCSADMRESLRVFFADRQYAKAELLAAGLVAFEATARNHYNLARAQAFNGKPKPALASLKLAVDAGYNNAVATSAEPAFAKLQDDPGFKRLLTAMVPAQK